MYEQIRRSDAGTVTMYKQIHLSDAGTVAALEIGNIFRKGIAKTALQQVEVEQLQLWKHPINVDP